MLLVQIILASLIVLLSYVIYSYLHLFWARKKLKWVPHAPRVPILGSILEFRNPTETLRDISRLTNNPSKMVYIEVTTYWGIVNRNYDLMEFMMSSTTVIDKSLDYKHLNDWLGTGLLTSTGAKWKKRRKAITPAFHFTILEQFVEVFENNGNILIEKLEREALGEESIDVYKYITACTLDIICESAMGVNIGTQNNKHQDYVFAVKDMSRIFMKRAFSAWRGFKLLFYFTEDYKKQQNNLKILHGFTNSIIEKRKTELKQKKTNESFDEDTLGRKRKQAFLDLLLNATIDGQPLSQEDIREEVDTFMFEGHDTTASAIASALYLLSEHLGVQKLVRDEQKQLYGDDKNRKTTYQDLQDMKYLDLVIKETLRLYPPVPIVGRYVSEDTEYKGEIIPKGTVVSLFIYGMNRDPDYFEEPEKFRPERFLNKDGKLPFSYVPFSAGPRNCIGQKFAVLEMKSIISRIIRNFELFPTDPPHKLCISNEMVLKSINGVKINLKKYHWEQN